MRIGLIGAGMIGGTIARLAVDCGFNTIYFEHLATQGLPAGTPERRALPIAGDDADAKHTVERLIDEFGFDVVDAGSLPEGRRFQPGSPAYNVRLTAEELRIALTPA